MESKPRLAFAGRLQRLRAEAQESFRRHEGNAPFLPSDLLEHGNGLTVAFEQRDERPVSDRFVDPGIGDGCVSAVAETSRAPSNRALGGPDSARSSAE